MADKQRRDKGDGSIYQRKDGSWCAQYTPEGTSKSKYLYGKTENEVKKKLRAFKKETIKNGYAEIQKITVKEYMDNWLNNVKSNELKPKSFDAVECTLVNQVYKHIGDIQIGGLVSNDVQTMINTLRDDGYTYSTIKKAYNAINACFKLGIIKGDVIKNPCVGVSLPKNLRRKVSDIRFFEQSEIDLICVESVARYQNGKQIYRLGHSIILLLYTGMRIAELLGLKWSNVNFDNETIKIEKSLVLVKNRDEKIPKKYIAIKQDSTKTDASERIIYLNDTALSALKELHKITGKYEYVMTTTKNQIIVAKNIDRMLRNILIKCNIDPCGVHALRHSYASMLFRKGVDVKTVSELLGHSDVAFTYNVYIHLIKEQKQEAVKKLDGVGL